ncbi:DUF2892 domain-containing protein [Flavobacterium sp. W22_SRS_FP1]
MGLIDKIIRSLIAAFIAILYFTNLISGTVALVLGAFAIIFIITSFVSFCPLYTPFGINTRKSKQ